MKVSIRGRDATGLKYVSNSHSVAFSGRLENQLIHGLRRKKQSAHEKNVQIMKEESKCSPKADGRERSERGGLSPPFAHPV